jgi:iron complex outermembrane receptor protein
MGLELEDRLFVAANNRPVRAIPVSYEAWYEDMFAPHLSLSKGFGGVSVYASYRRGYKAPVSAYFFIPTTGRLNQGLKPESGEQFEIGSKGSWLGRRLEYQVDAFHLVFSDKMTAVAVPLNVPTTNTAYSYITNGGRQNHLGVEAVIKGAVFRSKEGPVRGLSLFGNLAWSHFEYEDFRFETLRNKISSPATTLDSVTVRDYSGKAVAGTPDLTANAGLDFEMALGVYGNVVYSYRGETPFAYPQNFPDSVDVADAFRILNAKLGIRKSYRRLEADAHLGAENLTGAQYYYMLFANQLPDAYIPAKPEMTWYTGLSLAYRF